MERFQSLLAVSAFGDALLIKLICIQAFSEWMLLSSQGNAGGGGAAGTGATLTHARSSWSSQRLAARTATWLSARASTLIMGNHIAEKVLSSWSASLKKTKGNNNNGSQQLPSVRLLLPLLLLAEYVASCGEETTATTTTDHDDPDTQQHEKARNQFWKTVVLVWNLVQQFMDVPAVPPNDKKKKNINPMLSLDDKNEMQEEEEEEDLLLLQTQLMPKDYKSLAGFQPFSKIIPMNDMNDKSSNNNTCSAGFVSDEEAMRFF
jgi:hypothetical protein